MDVLFLEIYCWFGYSCIVASGINAGMGNIGCTGAVHNAAADVREVEAEASANFPRELSVTTSYFLPSTPSSS